MAFGIDDAIAAGLKILDKFVPDPAAKTQAEGELREALLARTMLVVNTPYTYGGNSPDGGFDCSGLIGYVYRGAAGVALPRTTREMNAMRGASVRREALQAGDLLFATVNLSRHLGHKAENALQAANRKFERRFRYVEAELAKQGRTPSQASLDEMEALWQQAKTRV